MSLKVPVCFEVLATDLALEFHFLPMLLLKNERKFRNDHSLQFTDAKKFENFGCKQNLFNRYKPNAIPEGALRDRIRFWIALDRSCNEMAFCPEEEKFGSLGSNAIIVAG